MLTRHSMLPDRLLLLTQLGQGWGRLGAQRVEAVRTAAEDRCASVAINEIAQAKNQDTVLELP